MSTNVMDVAERITPEPRRPRRRLGRAVLGVVLVVLLTAAYAGVLTAFIRAGAPHRASFAPVGGMVDDRVTVQATVLAVDPARNDYQVRLNLQPQGAFRGPNGVLAKPITVQTDEITGHDVIEYKPGQRMMPHDLTLNASGDTFSYPFDKHLIPLALQVADSAGNQVPVELQFAESLHDWSFDTRLEPGATPGNVVLDVVATRSVSVITFALGLMTVLGLLVVVTVGMVLRAVRLRKVGFTTIASLAATLFAIPGIRNSMPNTPPVGTLSDFVVSFWALLIVSVCMVVASLSWLRNADRKS